MTYGYLKIDKVKFINYGDYWQIALKMKSGEYKAIAMIDKRLVDTKDKKHKFYENIKVLFNQTIRENMLNE